MPLYHYTDIINECAVCALREFYALDVCDISSLKEMS